MMGVRANILRNGVLKRSNFFKSDDLSKYCKNSNLYQMLKIFAHTFVHLMLKKVPAVDKADVVL